MCRWLRESQCNKERWACGSVLSDWPMWMVMTETPISCWQRSESEIIFQALSWTYCETSSPIGILTGGSSGAAREWVVFHRDKFVPKWKSQINWKTFMSSVFPACPKWAVKWDACTARVAYCLPYSNCVGILMTRGFLLFSPPLGLPSKPSVPHIL